MRLPDLQRFAPWQIVLGSALAGAAWVAIAFALASSIASPRASHSTMPNSEACARWCNTLGKAK